MTNPNLIQKNLTDKNGVITRRWVKPADNGSAAKIAMPSPAPAQPKTNAPLFAAMMEDSPITRRFGVGIEVFDPRTVASLEELLESAREKSDAGERYAMRAVITESFTRMDISVHRQEFINNAAIFGATIIAGTDGRGKVAPYVKGLRETPEFYNVSDFLTDVTDEQREQALALVAVAVAAPPELINERSGQSNENPTSNDRSAHMIHLRDEPVGLRRFIMENHRQVDTIIDTLKARGVTDLDTLADVIGGPLGEGVL